MNIVKIFNNLLTEDNNRLIKNVFSLSLVQATNYLLPIITFPYLVRVLGPENFGLTAFAQSFITYFVILTDYGFNLSATRSISIFRNEKEKVSKIFSSVIMIKLFIGFSCLIIMTVVIVSLNKFRDDWLLYFFSFGSVIGNILFPVWLFQGMERMHHITVLNLLAKIIFTFSIFIFIRKPSDYIYVPLINSAGIVASGLLATYISIKQFRVSLRMPSVSDILFNLKEGWYIFISTAAINLYTNSNTFILGLLSNNLIVGYYAAGEKIVRAARDCLGPFSQAMYPHVNRLMTISKEAALEFIRKTAYLMFSIGLALSLFIFILAPQIISILLGVAFHESLVVLNILAFLPALISINNILGMQTMLTFNYKKAFFNILLSAGILNLGLALLLIPSYQHAGLAVSVLIGETFVTIAMFAFLYTKGINIFDPKVFLYKKNE